MFSSKNQFLGASSGGYQISRSVRTRKSAGGYFNRTPASASSRTTWTWSGWVKRGELSTSVSGGVFGIFGGGTLGTSQSNFVCYFNSAFDIYLQETVNNVSNQLIYQTTPIYRDPSAWYHVIIAMDTTQATASNRTRIYVNGVLAPGAFSVTPGQNQALSINNTVPQYIGGASVNPQAYGNVLGYFDGYYAEVNFIDGYPTVSGTTYNATTWAALNVATLFGQTNAVTGVWEPKAYIGTYGTNGYELNFSDNSASTAATIGKDYSGNSNNWTPNNISVTAGVTYDSMLDSPTLYADGGNGRGNYPVANPLVVTSLTYSNGNLTTTNATASWWNTRGTMAYPSTGKFYYEQVCTSGVNCWAGIGNENTLLTGNPAGYDANSYGYSNNGQKLTNSSLTAYGNSFTTNDIIGVAFDAATGSVWFSKNGVFQNSGNPAAETNFAFTGITGTIFPIFSSSGSGATVVQNYNFGQRPFTYTPPTGFVALNTQNLPTPTISNGAAYMAATTYTGTGAARSVDNSVNGVSFQPDWVWIKNRTVAYSHLLADSVRGTTKYIVSSSNGIENTDANSVTAFNSNGFSAGTLVDINGSGNAIVGWQWNAGGSTVTNTTGSISAQVRANATAGFSIVTYTGTGANATVGHGLGVAPRMILVKKRSAIQAWSVYHGSLANTQYLVLNTTATPATLASMWNSTTPTSSVFSIGTDGNTNTSAATYVAYCFAAVAGYSAFGSYTGNGSADGPFVYLGFRPRFIVVKRTDVTNAWVMFDTSRSTYNQSFNYLLAENSQQDITTSGSTDTLDFLSNGFKLRCTTLAENANGGTYIYMAFAENPFKNSLAR
jgi:hypothetical protein